MTSRLSSQLLRFPRGLEDLKTIFVPESSASEAEPSKTPIYSSQLVTLQKNHIVSLFIVIIFFMK